MKSSRTAVDLLGRSPCLRYLAWGLCLKFFTEEVFITKEKLIDDAYDSGLFNIAFVMTQKGELHGIAAPSQFVDQSKGWTDPLDFINQINRLPEVELMIGKKSYLIYDKNIAPKCVEVKRFHGNIWYIPITRKSCSLSLFQAEELND